MQITLSRKEPEWLQKKRIHAQSLISELPLNTSIDSPTEKFYTDFKELNLEKIEFQPQVDFSVSLEKKQKYIEKGLIISDLKSMLEENPSLIQRHLFSIINSNESKFHAVHESLAGSGAVIIVPKNLSVKEPISVQCNSSSEKGVLFHNLIILEENSEAKILEEFYSNGSAFHSSMTEVFLNANSKLELNSIQNLSSEAVSFSHKRVLLEKNSSLNLISCNFGAKLVKAKTEAILQGDGAQAKNFGAFSGSKSQHIDVEANLIHKAPRTTGKVLFNGVIKDNSKSVFRGRVKIHANAFQTNTDLTGNAIVLGEKAIAHSMPALEIDNNDVQARHAATVSQIDEEHLFYLASRGIPRKHAERMLVMAAFEEILNESSIDSAKKKINEILEQKFN